MIAECVTLESRRTKKSVECHSKEQKEHFQSYLSNWFDIMTTMILQNTISRFNLFWIESFNSWVCYFGEVQTKICWILQEGTEKSILELSFEMALTLWLQWFWKVPFLDSTDFELKFLIADCVTLKIHRKKVCWMSRQGTENSIFRVIFSIGFDITTTKILQNTISESTYFEFKVLIAECVTLESRGTKTIVECRSKEQRRAFSELSFELALTLCLQWFCKIPFLDSTYFELKVLIAEWKKKCVECRSKE